MKIWNQALAAVVAVVFSSIALGEIPIISLAGRFQNDQPQKYEALLTAVKREFRIPFYFSVPTAVYLDLPNDVMESRGDNSAYQGVLVNYRYTNPRRPEANQMGLRLLVVDGSKPRRTTSELLGRTGLLQVGDVLLSFRAKWYGTLRYSHIQLGVSHAGLAYVDRAADGKLYIYNLDMPLDTETVGKDKKSTISSHHYADSPLVHVLRPRSLTAVQKDNLLAWYRLMAQRAKTAWNRTIFFNKDYASPNYRAGQPLNFVGDLGRIALGLTTSGGKPLSMYCSEFAWSMLSLKNCDPLTDKGAFTKDAQPSCVEPIFAPMGVLGTLANARTAADMKDAKQSVGMADGPIFLGNTLTRGQAGLAQRNALFHKLFADASGVGESISSGHKAVEQSIMEKNPKFFEMLEAYYQMTGLPDPSAAPGFAQIFAAFNQSQYLNYSPTAFQVHAVLPKETTVKAMDYVLTIFYTSEATYRKFLQAAGDR